MTAVFELMAGISLQTGILIVLLMLLKPFLNRITEAKWKYRIWVLLAIRLLLPMNWPAWPGQSVLQNEIVIQVTPQYVSGQEERGKDADASVPEQKKDDKKRIPVKKAVSVIWIFAAVLFFSFHMSAYFVYRRKILRGGMEVRYGWLKERLEEELRQMECRCSPILILNRQVKQPQMIGLVKQYLILPRADYEDERLCLILRHELIHARRRDVWGKLLFLTALSLHWFNPLVYIMVKEAERDQERSCDDLVMRGQDWKTRKNYPKLLLDEIFADHVSGGNLASQLRGGKAMMRDRLDNIMNVKKRRGGMLFFGLIAVLTVCLSSFMKDTAVADVSVKMEQVSISDKYLLERYSGISDNMVSYHSYSVYGDVTAEELEYVAAEMEREMQSEPDFSKFSWAFYREDTDERIEAFMFKDGHRLEAGEDDYFVPANVRRTGEGSGYGNMIMLWPEAGKAE